MLVVDGYTLVAVHLLHFLNEVLLGGTDTKDFHDLFRIPWAIGDRLACIDVLTIFDLRTAARWKHDEVFFTLVVDDGDGDSLAFIFTDADNTRCFRKTC